MAVRSSVTPFFGSSGPRPLGADWTDEFTGVDTSLWPVDLSADVSSDGGKTSGVGAAGLDTSWELAQPGTVADVDLIVPTTPSATTSTEIGLTDLGAERMAATDSGSYNGGPGGRNGGNGAFDQDVDDVSWPVVPGRTIPDGELHIIGSPNDGLGPIYALPRTVMGGTHTAQTSYYDPSAIPFVGGTGDDVLTADGRASILLGGGGNDTLTGGAGRDILYGNAGTDRIEGGGGDDLLAGGPGSDTFVFKESWGADTLFDFEDAQDIIAFSKSLFADFADLQAHMQQVGEDVVVKLDDANVLTIKHTTLGQLGLDDFSFF